MCVCVCLFIYICVCACVYIHIYICACVCVCVYYSVLLVLIIFTNPSTRAGYDTRSIFERSLTGLNSEVFPSPRLVASIRLKNLVCPTIYP